VEKIKEMSFALQFLTSRWYYISDFCKRFYN